MKINELYATITEGTFITNRAGIRVISGTVQNLFPSFLGAKKSETGTYQDGEGVEVEANGAVWVVESANLQTGTLVARWDGWNR